MQFKDESAVADDELKEVVVEEPEAAVAAPEPEEVKVSISPAFYEIFLVEKCFFKLFMVAVSVCILFGERMAQMLLVKC